MSVMPERLLRVSSREIEIEVGEYDHREQQDIGERRRFARFVVLECDPVDAQRDRLGRGAGSAVGEQEDEIEQLERLDRAEQQRKQHQSADVWEGDRPKLAPLGDAVDGRGLVKIFRHADQPCEHEQHHERRPHPSVGENDADPRAPHRAHQNEWLAGNEPHRLGEQAEGRIVIVAKEGADRDEGQHHRREHENQEKAPQRELLRKQQR